VALCENQELYNKLRAHSINISNGCMLYKAIA
jgi:hypothetical protein